MNQSKDKPRKKALPGPRWQRWGVDIALIFAVVFAVHLWQTRNLPVGTAPELQGNMLSGEIKSLEDFRGTPVLVHFWATWCPICRTEEGSIDSLAEDYSLLTVATGSGTAAEIRKYMIENELGFPVMMDEDGLLGTAWGVRGVPSSFIIDADGQIRYVSVGYSTELGLRFRMWLAGL
jgi:peroxiredoxin